MFYTVKKKAELNESGFFLLDMTKKEDWALKQGLSSFQSQSLYQQVSDHLSGY